MKTTITVILAMVILTYSGCKDKAEVAAEIAELEPAAITAAWDWLKAVDSEEYEKSWVEATEYLRNATGKENWVKLLEAQRKPLGQMTNREVKKTQYKTTLPGSPDGQYFIIEYSSRFKNKEAALETLTTKREEDGVWRVAGYFIK